MEHIPDTPSVPLPPGGAAPHLDAVTWQEAVAPLIRLTIHHARRVCAVHGVPESDRADLIAEALLNLCTSVRNAFGRGTRRFDVRFFTSHALTVVRHTRRGRPPRLLGDVFEEPDNALAAGGPGPVEELEAREALQRLLSRLPDEPSGAVPVG
jgi:DNA-directed RNA polymerase specialized sigma24 family protein